MDKNFDIHLLSIAYEPNIGLWAVTGIYQHGSEWCIYEHDLCDSEAEANQSWDDFMMVSYDL